MCTGDQDRAGRRSPPPRRCDRGDRVVRLGRVHQHGRGRDLLPALDARGQDTRGACAASRSPPWVPRRHARSPHGVRRPTSCRTSSPETRWPKGSQSFPVTACSCRAPRSRASETVEILERRGATVVVLPIYRTVAAEIDATVIEDIRRGVDAVLFTSGSTVQHFMNIMRQHDPGFVFPAHARIMCIGPVTASAAREAGLRVDSVAQVHTTRRSGGQFGGRVLERRGGSWRMRRGVQNPRGRAVAPAARTAAAGDAGVAADGARDVAGGGRLRLPAVRDARARRAQADRLDAGHLSALGRPGGRGSRARRVARRSRRAALRHPGVQGSDRRGELLAARRRRAGGARDQAGGAGAGRDHRRVPVRVHRPRPLRRAQRRRRGAAAPAPPRGLRPERRDARRARSGRGRARGSGRRPRRAERHDRRHGAEHPHGPRRTPTSRTSVSCRTR